MKLLAGHLFEEHLQTAAFEINIFESVFKEAS